jgi:hypothetical protein
MKVFRFGWLKYEGVKPGVQTLANDLKAEKN